MNYNIERMKIALYILTCLFCAIIPSCTKDKQRDKLPIRLEEKIVINGLTRSYIIRLPVDYYEGSTDSPLLIGLHGTGGSGSQFESSYGFIEKGDKEGFITLYPDGIEKQDGSGLLKLRTWNAGSCCDYAMYKKIEDVKFLSILIDNISKRFRVNRHKIYVAGISNGGMMAYRLAAEIPEKITAIAVVAGTMVADKSAIKTGNVPIIHIHSATDEKVPFAGGIGLGGYNFPAVMEGINFWVDRNQCNTLPKIEENQGYKLTSWINDGGDKPIQLYLTNDGGHAWPSSTAQPPRGDTPSKAINATEIIWEFLNRYSSH